MSTARVRTGVDAWTSDAAPSLTTGEGKWLRLQDGTPTKHGFIHFKNPAPRGATILDAHLKIYEVGTFASTTLHLRRVDARWSESEINADNEPGVTGSTVTVTQAGSEATEWDFDVTGLLQTITDGAANYGFRLDTTDTTERKFYSLNAADNRPVLEVEWSDAPDTPTELSPSGGAAVSVNKPTLLFNFHDVSGETAMAALQVHIKATNTGWTAAAGYAAPDFDSGVVSSSDPELDLSATAFGGISAGATKYWTVAVQDAAGLWSQWSDPVHFTRNDKATLTIDNPAASPNDYVEDPTPELLWTVGSGTQLSWRVIITNEADPTNPLHDTGRRAGTANSYTLPAGVITDETATYRLTLRVWDDLTRVSTPNDAVFIEAVRTFTFQADPTPDAVTSLVAAQLANGKPGVVLTFDRATAPDGFTFTRNGKVIDHNLDPADLNTGSTHYRYVDHGAAPHLSHTFGVRPRVNSKVGPVATVDFSYETPTVWLIDRDTDRLVPVHVTDSFGFDMPELSASYSPVNGNSTVDVTQAQYGLTGTISGRIVDWAGMDAGDIVADLLWMKKRPQNTLRLILGAQNLPVTINHVVVAPLAGGKPDDRSVSFGFTSLGGVQQQ